MEYDKLIYNEGEMINFKLFGVSDVKDELQLKAEVFFDNELVENLTYNLNIDDNRPVLIDTLKVMTPVGKNAIKINLVGTSLLTDNIYENKILLLIENGNKDNLISQVLKFAEELKKI